MKPIQLALTKDNIGIFTNQAIFQKYLSEISKYKPLTREEEIELFKKIEETGDERAVDKICKHNLLFVVSVAKRYSNTILKSTLTLEDLVNEANIGLCIAIRRFNYKLGYKFISYAVWWIQMYILSAIKKHVRNIRMPESANDRLMKYQKKEAELEQKLGRTPSISEVFETMDDSDIVVDSETINRYENLIKINKFEIGLNQTLLPDAPTIGETLRSEDNTPDVEYLDKERNQLAIDMIDNLPPNMKDYIVDYFGLLDSQQLSLKEMSQKYGVSSDTIKRQINKSLKKIRIDNIENKEYFFPVQYNSIGNRVKDSDKNTIYCI